MKKQIKTITSSFIEFSEDELQELGIKPGDKFSCSTKDGNLFLEKYKTIDIDLESYTKDQLILLITGAHEHGGTVEEYIEHILEEMVKRHELQDSTEENRVKNLTIF